MITSVLADALDVLDLQALHLITTNLIVCDNWSASSFVGV
jgi:hypothetical protein